TSGINGGKIGLYGTSGVTLAATALLDASADGYAANDTRAATGGTIEIGTAGTGSIVVAPGARIDVAARRPGIRLIEQLRKDPLTLSDTLTYNYAQSDTGGIVAFRAPVLLNVDGEQTVEIRYSGTIIGAREVSVEGYRTYELGSMARASCANADICKNEAGQIVLDLNAEAAIGNLPSTNRLASTISGSIPDFIRNFDLSASNAGLGALTSADNFRARPGVQLEYVGDIVLASNWNLGAATVNVAAALADELLAPSPQLGNGLNYVVPGAEAQLYYGETAQGVRYTDFIYRVGGRADREAGVLTLRAGGTLDIRGSITDGFFNFADQTAPEYLSFQLGGGDRGYRPAFNVSCGGFSIPCDNVFTQFFVTDSATPPASTPDDPLISISVNRLVRGSDSVPSLGNPIAPYSAAANSPGALGLQAEGAGDPIGSAVVAPLLDGGKAAASFSLRLVGGAAADGALTLAVTADPLAVAASAVGKVSVSGGSTYRAAPLIVPQRYAGDLELSNRDPNVGATFSAAPSALRDLLEQNIVVLDGSSYTRLTLTGAPTAVRIFLVNAARDYIAANNIPADEYQFFGPPASPTILAARFDLIAAILQSVSSGFADRIGTNGFTYAAPAPASGTPLDNPNIATRSLVRTGTGTIDIVAAGDIDLTNGRAVFRNEDGRTTGSGAPASAQVGGAAVYTVGHRVDLTAQRGTDANGQTLAIDPAFPAAPTATSSFQPAIPGVLNQNAVYATGGGDIRLVSGRDVLARRDAWSEAFRGQVSDGVPRNANAGADTQLWRVITTPGAADRFSLVTNIQVNPQLFSTGVGALGGGSVRVEAQRNISDLTVVSDTSLTTALVGTVGQAGSDRALALISYGGGNVDVRAGRNLLGGQLDVASGTLAVTAGSAIASAGRLRLAGTTASPSAALEDNLLRIRVADATADISARGALTIAAITSTDGQGFFSQAAGVSLLANGDLRLTNAGKGVLSPFTIGNDANPNGAPGALLPGTLLAATLFGDLDLSAGVGSTALVLVPSPVGQLKLFAGGDIVSATLAMDDGDPSLTPGPLSAATPATLADINLRTPGTRLFGFPVILPNTSDAERRLLHNERATHANNPEPVRIFADGNINQLTLALPKQARISAGGDIIDMVFIGQNLNLGDVTRITAGRDIVASSRVLPVSTGTGFANLPVLQGNNFVLGGPGTLFVEAGRDLGPFFNSATIRQGDTNISYAGGILTVGNDYNPWLKPDGARLFAEFGVGNGANYDALRTSYVDPANVGNLDGDLFVQALDSNGNRAPDRSKPVYATALVGWLVENQPDAIAAAFGAPINLTDADVLPLLASLDAGVRTQFLADLPYLPIGGGINSPVVAIDRSNAAAPVLITGAAVATTPNGQRTNISGSTLVGWLAQNAPSVLTTQYRLTSTDISRAYAQLAALPPLVQRQFLLDRVYFNELASPSRPDGASSQQFIRGYRAVDLLFPGANGYTANDLGGTVNGGTRVLTGNLDLRLATLETQRGGDITILGPGGRVLGGSVVSTAAQATRRGAEVGPGISLFQGFRRASFNNAPAIRIFDIPRGFEGVLTLRGGSIRGFTDGDFLLNQSRLFTLAGGDVTLWSSNGDLNAGQGAKTSANNPPVVVRFDPNGVGTLDQAGTVAGAGIAALQPAGVDKAPDVTLIAPVGTVDAGDAGVRASGNVFVAAARVANADNFKVGGSAFGNIGGTIVDTGAAASANAASAAAAQAATAVNPSGGKAGDDRARISVEVLGFAGRADDDPCNLPANQRPANCPVISR
ncbi:filamentous hemagglutinin family protein, partial [Sandarakinorhabdus sp.]|uniref:filamentous haemagglutinin family protein n=1 Tax=Sandarakinorhabdus sp. TaxID=1916663 RepID=UPI00286E260E